jgi:hypothetical protein
MTPWKLAACLLLSIMVLVGCEGGTKFIAPAVPPPMSADALRAAPDTLSLVGFPSVISTYLYRDFMPMAPPDGNALRAIITFSLISPSDFSENVTAADVWIVNGSEVWGAPLQMQDLGRADQVVLWAEGGPKWGPGIQVNVILGLTIEGRGLQLVRLPDATIARTD